jgi:hypothetical protein
MNHRLNICYHLEFSITTLDHNHILKNWLLGQRTGGSPSNAQQSAPPGSNAANTGAASGSNTILAPQPSSTKSVPASSTDNNNPSPSDNNNNPSPPVTIVEAKPGPNSATAMGLIPAPLTPAPLFSSPSAAGEFGGKIRGALGLLPAAIYIAHTGVTVTTTSGVPMLLSTAIPTITTITLTPSVTTFGGAALVITGGVLGGALAGAILGYGLYKLLH